MVWLHCCREDDGGGGSGAAAVRATSNERQAGSSYGSSQMIKFGAGDQIGRLRSRRSEVAHEALTRTVLGDRWRRDGGGLYGDPPW